MSIYISIHNIVTPCVLAIIIPYIQLAHFIQIHAQQVVADSGLCKALFQSLICAQMNIDTFILYNANYTVWGLVEYTYNTMHCRHVM